MRSKSAQGLGASSQAADRQNGDEEATGDEMELPLVVWRNLAGAIQTSESRPETADDGHGGADFADEQCGQHTEHVGG
jgi:hypothetical protein